MRVLIALKMNANKLGAIEFYIARLAAALHERGDALVVAPMAASDEIAATWREHHAEVAPLGEKPLEGLLRVTLEQRPDVSILHFFPMVSPVAWISRVGGSKSTLVVDDHSGWPTREDLPRKVARAIAHRVSLAPTARVVAVSEFVKRRHIECAKLPAKHSRVVYNGVRAPAASGRREVSPTTIVMIGNMIHDKGFDLLIDACAALPKHHAPRVLLVGDGVERKSLEARAARVAPHANIAFLGRRDDVPELLATAHIAVVPSRWQEAFGCVTAESMRAGCCVIATDVGASGDLITHEKTGLIIPPDDASALANALQWAIENPKQRDAIAEAAKTSADARFDVERMVNEIHNLLIEVDHERIQKRNPARRRFARHART